MKKPRTFAPRKLLVAAAGVATINYVAIACGGGVDGNNNPPTSGNLPAPSCEDRPSFCTTPDTGPDNYIPPTSGNLPAPPPVDASADGDASDDGSIKDGGDAG